MNKRIFIFLLPILAIVVFTNCKAHYDLPSQNFAPDVSISTLYHYNATFSFSHNPETVRKDKNAIRIKARENAFAMLFASRWIPFSVVDNYVKPECPRSVCPLLESTYCCLNLRGPPCA